MEQYTAEQLVKMQREFFMTGVTKPLDYRYGALGLLKKAIQENEARIAEALFADLHKHPMESYMCETGLVLDEIGYHMKHLAGWMKDRRVRTPLAQFRSKSFVSPEPYGVVLIMAPWNYPFQLCIEPLIGAISAGNCAVIKPSAYAPATSHLLAEIIGSCFEPEYIAVKEGGRAENTDLLAQQFDYIFFTGSVDVGKVVMEAAAKHLTPMSLELGGKSPVIVDQTADLKVAARRVAFGKCINSGQTCVEPDYLLIHESVRDRFIECYKDALAEFFPDGKHDQMCRIISEKHYLKKAGLAVSEQWFPVADDDPDGFLMLTAIGGIFGLHKFKAGQIGKGILYLLTFGGFGVMYIFDLISLFMGGYYIKQTAYDETDGDLKRYSKRVYMGKPSFSIRNCVVSLLASIAVICAVRFIYIPVSSQICYKLANSFAQGVIEYSEQVQKEMDSQMDKVNDLDTVLPD